MNFDWVKVPKSEKEEKEQFDTLYQFLSGLSNKAKENTNEIIEPSESSSSINSLPLVPLSSSMDEFSRLRLDLLSNFQNQGVGITPLQTCKGCDRSFYSELELERHWEQSCACLEWVNRGLSITDESATPFFSFLEKGLASLLGSDKPVPYCIFCKKQINNRKAQEKHYQQSMICNRLAHDTFSKWMCKK
jgi:hypothetical protein